MKTRVEVLPQVAAFVAALPPEPRRALRTALRQLADWRGDIAPLRGKLEGFYRLRVDRWRVVFCCRADAQGQVIQCVFAAPRQLVYEIFRPIAGTEGLSEKPLKHPAA